MGAILGGISIFCGRFKPRDKSGSAFAGVLNELQEIASGEEAAILGLWRGRFDEEDAEYLLIEPEEVRAVLPLLRLYKGLAESRLFTPGDVFGQMGRDEELSGLDSTDLKYGAGLGWRVYCAQDLLGAFEVADTDSEQVALVFG